MNIFKCENKVCRKKLHEHRHLRAELFRWVTLKVVKMAVGLSLVVVLLYILRLLSGLPVEKSELTVTLLQQEYAIPTHKLYCSTTRGIQNLIIRIHCNQTHLGFPIRAHCQVSLFPKVDIFAVFFTTTIQLDGKSIAFIEDHGGREIASKLPLFAHETYEFESDVVFPSTRLKLVPPKGHYEIKSTAINQDDNVLYYVRCPVDIIAFNPIQTGEESKDTEGDTKCPG